MSRRAVGIASAACLLSLCFPIPQAVAQPARLPDAHPLVPRGAPVFELHRAVNIETWFRLNDDVSSWSGYLSDDQIGQLVAVGFGTVRLAVAPEYFMGEGGSVRLDRWSYVDEALDRLTRAGLTVVVDLHTTGDVRSRFALDERFRAQYVEFAGHVAGLLAARDPRLVALSPIQEPYDPSGQWNQWQQALHQAARANAPALTLVATGDDYGSVHGLVDDTAYIDDPNLIWDVHVYDPFLFTHQGAPFMGYPYRALRRVPFPSSPHNVRPAIRRSAAAAPHRWDRRVRADLRRYGRERWQRRDLGQIMGLLASWSQEHDGARVWIGEFGVDSHAPPRAAYRWWRQARTRAEQAGIPWSTWFWWDYASINGDGGYDVRLARALGLGVPARAGRRTVEE